MLLKLLICSVVQRDNHNADICRRAHCTVCIALHRLALSQFEDGLGNQRMNIKQDLAFREYCKVAGRGRQQFVL